VGPRPHAPRSIRGFGIQLVFDAQPTARRVAQQDTTGPAEATLAGRHIKICPPDVFISGEIMAPTGWP